MHPRASGVRWLSVRTLKSQNSKTEDEALLRVSNIVVDRLAAMLGLTFGESPRLVFRFAKLPVGFAGDCSPPFFSPLRAWIGRDCSTIIPCKILAISLLKQLRLSSSLQHCPRTTLPLVSSSFDVARVRAHASICQIVNKKRHKLSNYIQVGTSSKNLTTIIETVLHKVDECN